MKDLIVVWTMFFVVYCIGMSVGASLGKIWERDRRLKLIRDFPLTGAGKDTEDRASKEMLEECLRIVKKINLEFKVLLGKDNLLDPERKEALLKRLEK